MSRNRVGLPLTGKSSEEWSAELSRLAQEVSKNAPANSAEVVGDVMQPVVAQTMTAQPIEGSIQTQVAPIVTDTQSAPVEAPLDVQAVVGSPVATPITEEVLPDPIPIRQEPEPEISPLEVMQKNNEDLIARFSDAMAAVTSKAASQNVTISDEAASSKALEHFTDEEAREIIRVAQQQAEAAAASVKPAVDLEAFREQFRQEMREASEQAIAEERLRSSRQRVLDHIQTNHPEVDRYVNSEQYKNFLERNIVSAEGLTTGETYGSVLRRAADIGDLRTTDKIMNAFISNLKGSTRGQTIPAAVLEEPSNNHANTIASVPAASNEAVTPDLNSALAIYDDARRGRIDRSKTAQAQKALAAVLQQFSRA